MEYGWLLIIIAASMWGIDGVLLTPRYFSLGFFDVKFIVFVSHLIPTIILSILFTKKYRKIKEFSYEDYKYYFLIALFGGTIGTLSIVKALQLSNYSLSLVTIIQKAQPIFAIILAYIILKEKPKNKFYIVFIITLISLYILVFGINMPNILPENNIRAAFYSIIAAISFGSATVFGRKISIKYDFLTVTFYRFLFTSIISGGILFFTSKNLIQTINVYISNKNIYTLTVIIAFYSLTAILLYYKGMKTTKAMYATLCELFFPLTSVVVEAIFLKHYLSLIQIIAAIVLLISIVYLNIEKNDVL